MKYSACLVGGLVLLPINVDAQVVPDGSLSTEVTTSDRLNYIIEAGNRQGNNLFHSFESFSVPTNGSVLFNNATDLQNIFSRVTGGSISEIDGLIRSLGETNLFLLNPNGIIFGEGAVLDIGGSFFASTGESINFADGTKFSAINSNDEPLLTVSIPIGLQYGSNPGDIRVLGTGQQIINNTDPLLVAPLPLVRTNNRANLEVAARKTLALVGGDVTLEASSLRANEGRIELGAVSSGIVGLEQTASEWQLDYTQAIINKDINLQPLSALDASGITSQGIYLTGRQITLNDGSVALVQIQNATSESKIELTATELIKISGTNSTALIPSSINLFTLEDNSASLSLTSPKLIIERGGSVNFLQRGINRGGDLNANITEEIIISGYSPFNSELFSSLAVFNRGNGQGGNVNVTTNKLSILDGGFLGSITVFGTGSGGNVNIQATESIAIRGQAPRISPDRRSFSASINTSTFGRGNGGRIEIATANLKISESGDIDSNTLAGGNAGEIKINATESVEIVAPTEPGFSTISSGSISNLTELKLILGLPPMASGDGGQIAIETSQLRVTGKDAAIDLTTDGIGRAGNLKINADTIFLTDGSSISASTISGEGGNIDLQVFDLLFLENNSSIAAKAENRGNGGNIAIASDLVTLTENSQINANAIQGNGGNIQIDTLGFFNSSNSQVDASSRLGINGIVQIEELDTEPILGLENIATKIINPARLVILSCDLDTENSFIVTNRSGLPPSAEDVLSNPTIWQDWRIPREVTIDSEFESLNIVEERDNIIEAREWKINERGNIVLSAKQNEKANSSNFWQSPSCELEG